MAKVASRVGEPLKLLFCVAGIYSCYLTYGIYQEKIYKYRGPKDEKFHYTFFLLLAQCIVNFLVALVGVLAFGNGPKKVPLTALAVPAATYLFAMVCSNEALKHVNYPTQVLGKSCKMIPVMLMGIIIRGRKYTLQEYLCVGMITAGITMYNLYSSSGSKKKETETSIYGLGLLFLSLVLDGLTGPKQEVVIHKYQPSTHSLMLQTNGWAIVYALAASLVTNQLNGGLQFCLEHPELLNSVLVFSITSALGQNFIFYTIKTFSALTCTTITTTRKFFTLFASVFIYNHTLNQNQWIGASLVNLGLAWELKSKYDKHRSKQKYASKEKAEPSVLDDVPTGAPLDGLNTVAEGGVVRRKSRRAE